MNDPQQVADINAHLPPNKTTTFEYVELSVDAILEYYVQGYNKADVAVTLDSWFLNPGQNRVMLKLMVRKDAKQPLEQPKNNEC